MGYFGIGGGSGVSNHALLSGRNLPDQHPLTAITNLTVALTEAGKPTNTYARYTAAVALSGQRVAVLNDSGKLVYADADNLDHAGAVLGLTTGAIEAGAEGEVLTRGEIEEPTWNWPPRALIYLRNNGQLLAVPPNSGFLCVVGFSLSATKLYVAIQPSIVLA